MDFPLTSSGFQFKYLGAALGFGFLFRLLGIPVVNATLLCVGISLLASFSYSGLEISEGLTSSRRYVDILGWRIGKWQTMPKVVGVTVKYFSALENGTPANMSWGTWRPSSRRLEELVIMLSIEHSRQGLIIGRTDTSDVQKAIDAAQQVAQTFSVSVSTYLPAHLAIR